MKTGWVIFLVIALLVFSIGACDTEQDDPWTHYDGSRIVCRRSGCGRSPVYSDWNRRYCSAHISDDHYCRYPGCMNRISNSSTGSYCSKHD